MARPTWPDALIAHIDDPQGSSAVNAAIARIWNAIPLAMVVTDGAGCITDLNSLADALFGYAAESAVGVDIRTFVAGPADRNSVIDGLGLRGGTGDVFGKSRLVCAQRRDGTVFPVELSIGAIGDGETPAFAFFFRDLTDRVATEERQGSMRDTLLRETRRGAMDEFAGGLAHELNQPLAAASYFIGAADALLADEANREQGRALMNMGGEQVLRGGEIIRSLRTLMSRDALNPGHVLISDVIEDAVALAFVGESRQDIALVRNFDVDADLVEVDRGQIAQMIYALLRNAIVALRNAPPGERAIMVTTKLVSSGTIELSIADTGSGLSQEMLERTSEPLGIAKASASAGVGLAQSQRIVAAHGGRFAAANRPEGGAIFRITLFRTLAQSREANA